MSTRKLSRRNTTTTEEHDEPVAPAFPRDAFDRHAAAAALLMNAFHLRHMVRIYQAFEGDLVEALVLGEVAHHNVSGVRSRARDARHLSELLRARHEPGGLPLLPTNAFSIAAATGIPRETVRRKVAALERKGWLERGEDGDLFVTAAAKTAFGDFNVSAAQDLVAVAADLASLLGTEIPLDPRRPTRTTARAR